MSANSRNREPVLGVMFPSFSQARFLSPPHRLDLGLIQSSLARADFVTLGFDFRVTAVTLISRLVQKSAAECAKMRLIQPRQKHAKLKQQDEERISNFKFQIL